MNFTKNDKWNLASNMQKAIRRGLTSEAIWSLENLYEVDRAYLAYRLSVIAMEDISCNIEIAKFISDSNEFSWGAKRFNKTKSELDKKSWIEAVEFFAKSIKDRTPCEWINCRYYLNDFEKIYGKWQEVSINQAINDIYTNKQWWVRGLMAWRLAGTDRFPDSLLPEASGDIEEFLNLAPKEVKPILSGFGLRQREAHPVFLPLAYFDRKNSTSEIKQYIVDSKKIGPWLSCSLDKHTLIGKRAIYYFVDSLDAEIRNTLLDNRSKESVVDLIGQLMFWVEGGVVNQNIIYPISETISKENKKMWLKNLNLNGKWVADNLINKDLWEECKQRSYDYQKPDLISSNFT